MRIYAGRGARNFCTLYFWLFRVAADMYRTRFHKADLLFGSSGTTWKSRRVATDVPRRLLNPPRFSLSRDAELLWPWNVRDKLHERMPCGVTENGREHLFSFSGHVTTASGRNILYVTLYSLPRASSRSRSRPTTIFHIHRTTCLMSRRFNLC